VITSRKKQCERYTKIINLYKKRRGHKENLSRDRRIIKKITKRKVELSLWRPVGL
jgi:hypothetical protein